MERLSGYACKTFSVCHTIRLSNCIWSNSIHGCLNITILLCQAILLLHSSTPKCFFLPLLWRAFHVFSEPSVRAIELHMKDGIYLSVYQTGASPGAEGRYSLHTSLADSSEPNSRDPHRRRHYLAPSLALPQQRPYIQALPMQMYLWSLLQHHATQWTSFHQCASLVNTNACMGVICQWVGCRHGPLIPPTECSRI